MICNADSKTVSSKTTYEYRRLYPPKSILVLLYITNKSILILLIRVPKVFSNMSNATCDTPGIWISPIYK